MNSKLATQNLLQESGNLAAVAKAANAANIMLLQQQQQQQQQQLQQQKQVQQLQQQINLQNQLYQAANTVVQNPILNQPSSKYFFCNKFYFFIFIL